MTYMKEFGKRPGPWFAVCTALMVWAMVGCLPDQGGINLDGSEEYTVNVGDVWMGGSPRPPAPPIVKYPVFGFTVTRDTTYKSMSEYSISLTWVDVPAGMTDTELTAKAEEAFVQYSAFMQSIDPLPFYDFDRDGIAGTGSNFAVFTFFGSLDNGASGANGPIVINRYWPPSLGAANAAAWLAAAPVRIAKFNAAVTEIELMMTAIQDSLLYKTGPVDAKGALWSLYTYMEAAVDRSGSPMQRSEFTPGLPPHDNEARLPPGIGILYEYYLGYMPSPSPAFYTTGGDYSFP